VVRTCHPRPRGKHIDTVELRVVAAAVLAVTVDAVLVAQHLSKLGAHLVTALASLHVKKSRAKKPHGGGGTREKKGGEERSNVRNSVW
jgi:hypothetical protein